MASYLWGWIAPSTTETPVTTDGKEENTTTKDALLPPPEIVTEEVDDDTPPAFPLPNSIQRSSVPNSISPRKPNMANLDATLMPPPPAPGAKPVGSTGSTNATSSLSLPISTTRKPPNVNSKRKAREKVALEPGHSPLDWARLKSSGTDLRAGVTSLLRVTPSELKKHNTPEDAWASFGGKVYNVTPYLSFHPGGQKELMRVAGRDGTKLFALTHSWVNLDFMLDGCMVGMLVPE